MAARFGQWGGRGGGGETGGARGAAGEANGDDQKPAAPVWHGHASGGHGSGHADIGMGLFLSTWGSIRKTDRVTRCQIEFPTGLQKKFFPKSKLVLYKNFIEHLLLKRGKGFWAFKIKDIWPGKITGVDIGPEHLPWGF